ncbi:DUF6893 family small protein [Streptomyces sp. SYSU K217416]
MKKSLVGGIGGAAAATALAAIMRQVLPDLRRYLRIRKM